jgi:hypothetical protein
MKYLLVAVIALLCLFGTLPTPAAAQDNITLWAGQNIDAGSITVDINGDTLIVNYETTDGWLMTKTHLYAGTEIPAKSAPGLFPYKHEDLGGVATDNYSVSLSELGLADGGTLYIAAQAAIQKPMLDENGAPVLDEDGNAVFIDESAWAKGSPIRPGKNWAMYFSLDAPAAVAPAQ